MFRWFLQLSSKNLRGSSMSNLFLDMYRYVFWHQTFYSTPCPFSPKNQVWLPRYYAHQVTALSLSILRKNAYTRYTDVREKNGAELISFKTWCIQQGAPIQILANVVRHGDDPVACCTFDSHSGLVSQREVIGSHRRLGVHSRSLQLRSLAPVARA